MMSDTVKIDKRSTKLIAHRGLSGIEKENTNSAFVAAANRSYYGIETDVHKTADGKYVIIHNNTTAESAIDSLTVEDSTYDTLRSLIFVDKDGKKGRSDLRMPSLEEYLGVCVKYRKHAVLELKNEFDPDSIAEICKIIDECGSSESITVISFCLSNLIALRSIRSDIPEQYLVSSFSDEVFENLSKYSLGLDIYHAALTPEIVGRCHAAGFEVNCWTVDSPEKAEELIGMGVDYITTNILE